MSFRYISKEETLISSTGLQTAQEVGIKMNYEMFICREMFRSKHKTFRIHFGKPVPWQTFDSSKKPSEWAEWVKGLAYNLRKT